MYIVHCTSFTIVHMENVFFFIFRNILYVKEAEMKIGLETTLSFLWEVFWSYIFYLLPHLFFLRTNV